MESTEVTSIDLYKALCVIKDICRNHPYSCKGCPLSIETHDIDADNKGYSYAARRVHNQRYPNISRPDTWKLTPPTGGYNPFSDE